MAGLILQHSTSIFVHFCSHSSHLPEQTFWHHHCETFHSQISLGAVTSVFMLHMYIQRVAITDWGGGGDLIFQNIIYTSQGALNLKKKKLWMRMK